MKWIIVVQFLVNGSLGDDVIQMGAEVTSKAQCWSQAQPVVAMWAGERGSGVQVVKFTCMEDDGRGRA